VIRDLKRRIAKLEATGRGLPLVMHFDNGHTRTPILMSGGVKNFFRIVSAIDRPLMASRTTLDSLYLVKEAARFDGPSAQLFYLAQALSRGQSTYNQHYYPEGV
jgi:hypothetical protein